MKFSLIYEELKFDDVFKKATPEELETRRAKHYQDKRREAFERVEKTQLPDGTWHAHGDVFFGACRLSSLEDLKISIVDGDFSCQNNKLTNFEGSPKIVHGDFRCWNNNITSLEGAPKEVGRDYIYDNKGGKRFNIFDISDVINVKGHIRL